MNSRPSSQCADENRETHNSPSTQGKNQRKSRRGAILVLSAFLMIAMMAMVAFAVDMGYILTIRTDMQRATDAAALAGAGALVDGQDVAEERAIEFLVRNPIGNKSVVISEDMLAQEMAKFKQENQDDYSVKLGHWDPVQNKLVPATHIPSAIDVTYTLKGNDLFFAPLIGKKKADVTAQSIAMYQPRDIVLSIDLSASMNDDSEFQSINTLGRATVENNLAQMYAELGSPDLGDLPMWPEYATIKGAPPANSNMPQISVQYQYNRVYITTTKTLTQVKLKFSNGQTQTFTPGGTSGTFQGSGSNGSRQIYNVWVRSGSNNNIYGSDGEPFDFSTTTKARTLILNALDLNNVAYPYSGGSWNDYYSYCTSSSGQNYNAGYQWKFGFISLMNYWLEKYPSNSQNPDLWKVSAQPITALKNSVDIFMAYIKEVDANDRVGLAVYNAPNGNGKLEFPLTEELEQIQDATRLTQAGGYHQYTNIGGGLKTAREELVNNARPGAFKMIVLMTDGVPNWVNNSNSTSNSTTAKNFVIAEANLAKAAKIPVVTISLGSGADKALMQQVADITGGKHFNIPGGQTAAEYEEDLKKVFREIADDRPLKLVK